MWKKMFPTVKFAFDVSYDCFAGDKQLQECVKESYR